LKALVTGGAGFIGSHVVDALVERGHDVLVFDNLTTGYRANVSPDARLLEGDIRDAHAVLRAAHGAEAIFHLAASVGNKRGIENPTNDATINAVGTLNVLEAARITECRKVVYSSSAAIYGETRTMPVDLEHPKRPLTPYAVSKLAGENYVLSYNELYGIDGVCLRYFNVYGERQRFDAYGNVLPIFATRAIAGENLIVHGDGMQTRDFVSVRDVAVANISAAETHGARGAFNVGSGVATTINDLAAMVVGLLGTSVGITHAPPRAGDVRDSRADISITKSVLGFSPSVQLKSGVDSYLRWLHADRLNCQ
jgi:UDP-glucose 4-epimerase